MNRREPGNGVLVPPNTARLAGTAPCGLPGSFATGCQGGLPLRRGRMSSPGDSREVSLAPHVA